MSAVLRRSDSDQEDTRELSLDEVKTLDELKQAAGTLFGLPAEAVAAILWDDEDEDELIHDKEVRRLGGGARLVVRVENSLVSEAGVADPTTSSPLSGSRPESSGNSTQQPEPPPAKEPPPMSQSTSSLRPDAATFVPGNSIQSEAPPAQSDAAPQGMASDSDAAAIELARSQRLPEWWQEDPSVQGLAGVPIEDAISRMLRDSCVQLFDTDLPPMLGQFTATKVSRAYRQSKPWMVIAKRMELDEAQAARTCMKHMQSFAAEHFDSCELVESNGSVYIHIIISPVLWGHELRRRHREPTMDPLLRGNVLRYVVWLYDRFKYGVWHRAMQELSHALESCVMPAYRSMLQQGMRHVQEKVIRCCPGEAEYKERAEAQADGFRKTKGLSWHLVQKDELRTRLACRAGHEFLAALFLEYGDWVGKDMDYWDSTSVGHCVMTCKAFNISIKQAAARGWCSPDKDLCKQRGCKMSISLQAVARMVRDIRNPIAHANLLDIDYHKTFETMINAAAMLGGDTKGVMQLRDGAKEYFPAKTTAEEARQYDAEYAKLSKRLTGQQSKKLDWLLRQKSGCYLLQAASGTGKTLLSAKYACNDLIEWRSIAEKKPQAELLADPLLILVPSTGLVLQFLATMRQDLGDCEMQWICEDGVRLSLPPCQSAHAVIFTIDAFLKSLDQQESRFGIVLVDEGHLVFSKQSDPKLAGQHIMDAGLIWNAIREHLTDDYRAFVFHDISYQCIGDMPVWPAPHEEHMRFLDIVIRMPASVRDQSVPYCRELENPDGIDFFQLQNNDAKGPEIRHYQSPEECLDLMLGEGSELEARSVAVIDLDDVFGGEHGIKQAKRRVQSPKAKAALDSVGWGVVSESELYWGPIQNFVGLERAVVVVLVPKLGVNEAAQASWYAAITRCTYQLCVASQGCVSVEADLGHYKIGQMTASGEVPHSIVGSVARVATSGQMDGTGRLEMDETEHIDPVVQAKALTGCTDMKLLLDRMHPNNPQLVWEAALDAMAAVGTDVLATEAKELLGRAPQLVAWMVKDDGNVRISAVELLCKLPIGGLAHDQVKELGMIAKDLISSKNSQVAVSAAKVLVMLDGLNDPQLASDLVSALVPRLKHVDAYVQQTTLEVFGLLTGLAWRGACETRLQHSDPYARMAALAVVRELPGLAKLAPEILARVGSSQGLARRAALELLRELPAEKLVRLGPEIVGMVEDYESDHILLVHERLSAQDLVELGVVIADRLESSDGYVRERALKVLGDLPGEGLVNLAPHILARLEHSNSDVRRAALEVLGKLPVEELVKLGPKIVGTLEHSNWGVTKAALDVLGKLPREELVKLVPEIVGRLEHSGWDVRRAALEALGKLPGEQLMKLAPEIVGRLEHSHSDVRRAALELLGKLPVEELVKLGPKIVGRLQHSHSHASSAALDVLGKLPVEELVKLGPKIVGRLEDSNWGVERAALDVLGKLPVEELVKLVPEIVGRLEDSNWGVERAALDVLGKLPVEELVKLVPEIVGRLEDSHSDVRSAALGVLRKLPGEELVKLAPEIVGRLEDSDLDVRRAALDVLGKLPVEELVKLGPEIVGRLDELRDSDVRRAALDVLGKLPGEELVKLGPEIVGRLEHSNWGVRRAALELLWKLPGRELVKHVPKIVGRLEDSDSDVERVALDVLGKLPVEELVKLGPKVVKLGPEIVGREYLRAALDVLGKLPGEELVKLGPEIVGRLEHGNWGVRRAALEVLGKLPVEELVKLGPEIVGRLEDSHRGVERAALDVLGKLPVEELVKLVPKIVSSLEDSHSDVRRAALELLGKLPVEDLGACEAGPSDGGQAGGP